MDASRISLFSEPIIDGYGDRALIPFHLKTEQFITSRQSATRQTNELRCCKCTHFLWRIHRSCYSKSTLIIETSYSLFCGEYRRPMTQTIFTASGACGWTSRYVSLLFCLVILLCNIFIELSMYSSFSLLGENGKVYLRNLYLLFVNQQVRGAFPMQTSCNTRLIHRLPRTQRPVNNTFGSLLTCHVV